MSATLPRPIFGDKLIQATELNRRSGHILDMAMTQPVTITRKDEFFTLIRREDISSLVNQADQTRLIFELINAAFRILHGDSMDAGHAYGWLRAFDAEEIQELVQEVTATYRKAEFDPEYGQELQAVIHEWHESAIATLSDDLAEAWDSPADEIALIAHTNS
ncbi:MAG: hypothetical protein WA902_10535 [Thermosynechococcaceae cyanobacterium]